MVADLTMTAAPVITNFSDLYDVPAGNGLFTRTAGVESWTDPASLVNLTTVPLLAPLDDLRNVYNPAANRVLLGGKIGADAANRFQISANGDMSWGAGASTLDILLRRVAAGVLAAGGTTAKATFRAYGIAGTDVTFESFFATETNARWQAQSSGQMWWGPGNAAMDTLLVRGAANQLNLGQSAGPKGKLRAFGSVAADNILEGYVTTDAVARIQVGSDGKLSWSDGTAAVDTTLYRSAAGVLRSDNAFWASGMALLGNTSLQANSLSTAASLFLQCKASAATIVQHAVYADGKMDWGDGTFARDIALSRPGRGQLLVQAPQAASFAGTLASGSPIVTAISSTTTLAAGMAVSGTGIPANTIINTVDSATQITLNANATANGAQTLTFAAITQLVLKQGPASAGNLFIFEVQNQAGVRTFGLDQYGQANAVYGLYATGNAGTAPTNGSLKANPIGTANGLVVYSPSGATGDLARFLPNSVLKTRIDKNATIITGVNAAPADADLNNSEVALWLDATPGATKVMFKAKDSAGTVRTATVAMV
jgi:hypothetical protein